MILTAFLMAAFASVPDAVGPFLIETKIEQENGFPYPIKKTFTNLRWTSPSKMASYELSDDGGELVLTYIVRNCSGRTGPLRLSAKAAIQFGRDDMLACAKVLDQKQLRVLNAEIHAAQPFFETAYSRFRATTLAQHGPSLQRCRETAIGYHGPICVTFWDEGRTVNDQLKDKRKR